MKSPLMERPIFHQLVHRVETHIFLCVLAYHLLTSVEKTFLDQGIHTSWASLREQLATHQVVTVVLPTSDGQQIRIRKATTPEPEHKRIYQVLRIPENILTRYGAVYIVTECQRKWLIPRDRALNCAEVGLGAFLTMAQSRPFTMGQIFSNIPPMTRVFPLLNFLHHEHFLGWAYHPWRLAPENSRFLPELARASLAKG